MRCTGWSRLIVIGLAFDCACSSSGQTAAVGTSSPSPSVAATATNPSSSPTAQASAGPNSDPLWAGSVLTFELDGTPNKHFTLADPRGQQLKTIDLSGFASGVQGDGAALVLFGSNALNQAVWVVARDGTVIAIPTSVGGAVPPDAILLDDHTVLGAAGDQLHAKYDLIDFTSGRITTLLTVAATQRTGGIQPQALIPLGTSADRRVAHVLVRHATVNGTSVPEWAVVDIDLASNTVTGIRQVPVAKGVDPYDAAKAALSVDGRFLAYEEGTTSDAQQRAVNKIHIVDLTNGNDVVIVNVPITVSNNSRGLRFSPDGKAVIAYGYSWPPNPNNQQDAIMGAFATADGRALSLSDVGSPLDYNIEPMGWVGEHTLAYTTNTSPNGNFDGSNSAAHTLDVFTNVRSDLPTGLGLLVAVLN